MKTIKETKKYIIVEKRSNRYGVKDAETKKWINGDEKIKILLKEKLIKVAAPKPKPVEEAAPEETTEETPTEEATEETKEDSSKE